MDYLNKLRKNAGLKESITVTESKCDSHAEDEETGDVFKQGEIVKYKKKDHVIEVPNARGDQVGIIPLKLKDGSDKARRDAVDLVSSNELSKIEKEKMPVDESTCDTHAEDEESSGVFKKGDIVKYKKEDHVIEVPNAKGDYIGIIPLKLKDASDKDRRAAVDLVYFGKLVKENAVDGTVWGVMDDDKDESPTANVHDDSPFPVPKKILTSLKREIGELKRAVKDDNLDTGTGTLYLTTIEAFGVILAHLEKGTLDGFKWAQIDMAKLMSIISVKLPDDVYDFITRGGKPETLLSLFKKIK